MKLTPFFGAPYSTEMGLLSAEAIVLKPQPISHLIQHFGPDRVVTPPSPWMYSIRLLKSWITPPASVWGEAPVIG